MPPRTSLSRLAGLVGRLRRLHGRPVAPPTTDPYHLLLWEQVGYLATDERRLEAYRMLEARVGLAPAAVLDAPRRTLQAVARRGGAIGIAQRAERLRQVADRVLRVSSGDLGPVVGLPLEKARRELARYPGIGPAGAERILLLSGAYPVLGLDSNAVRVLERLGYGRDTGTWDATYREVQAAASAELPPTARTRAEAFLLLRRHGQTMCRRSAPRCAACPLRPDCPTGRHRATEETGA